MESPQAGSGALTDSIRSFCNGKTIEKILSSSSTLEHALQAHDEIAHDAIYTYKVIAGAGPLGLAVDRGTVTSPRALKPVGKTNSATSPPHLHVHCTL
jgi:hypothetical protein